MTMNNEIMKAVQATLERLEQRQEQVLEELQTQLSDTLTTLSSEQKRVLDYLTRQSEQRDQAISSYDTELNNLRKSLGLPHRETLINI